MLALPVLLLAASQAVLWQPPQIPPHRADLTKAANNASPPQAPWTFLSEDLAGNSPKVLVRDAAGRIWQVKGGPEGRADTFIARFVASLGYYADSIWFVERGNIEGIRVPLRRARGFIQPDGSFTYAAFELRDSRAAFLPRLDWKWIDNPFTNTHELAGLRLLVMLFSNWDNKDKRDARLGSNTGVLRFETGKAERYVYYVTDWGQSLGSWGTWFGLGRSNWNCSDYRRETTDFLRPEHSGRLVFGYKGQHTDDFVSGIGKEDVKWLMNLIGRVTDAQIGAGLKASGASPSEQQCFTHVLRDRIERMRRVAAE